MSLHFQIVGVKGNLLKNKKLRLQVAGSKAGSLLSPPSDGQLPHWKPPFRIDCSQYDTIRFTLYEDWETQAIQVANSFIVCANFVQKYKKSLQQLQSDLQSEARYELALHLNTEEVLGQLIFQFSYDPQLQFEGEIPQKLNLSLKLGRPPPKKPSNLKQSKPPGINFYNGKCKTVNTFSFMDEGAIGQSCTCSQGLYREGKTNNSLK